MLPRESAAKKKDSALRRILAGVDFRVSPRACPPAAAGGPTELVILGGESADERGEKSKSEASLLDSQV